MKRIKLFLAAATVLFSSVLNAQDGAFTSYSPYSVFGVGNMSRQGNAYSLSMGGVGIASRSNRFINIVNPAAVTARDTLSFMLDFGLSVDNRVYRQGDVKSAKNLFNISNFTFSVPNKEIICPTSIIIKFLFHIVSSPVNNQIQHFILQSSLPQCDNFIIYFQFIRHIIC